MSILTHKKCNNCGEVKPIDAFTVVKNRLGGRHSICKMCKSIYDKEYRKANAKRISGYHSQYWQENKEKIKERFNQWCSDNFQKIKLQKQEYAKRNRTRLSEYHKEWRKENRDHLKEYVRSYRKENRERLNLSSLINLHIKRAKKKKIGGSFTIKQWRELCDYYGNKCLKCGKSGIKLTIDHVVPTNLGGHNNIDNLQPLCLSCNCSKHDTYIDYRPDGGAFARLLLNE